VKTRYSTVGLAILIVVALGYLSFLTFHEMSKLYIQAEPSVRLGVVTAIGSVIAFVANNAIQSSRERRARLFESKREAYDKFFNFFTLFFHKNNTETPMSETEMMESFRNLATGIMTWGSASTINAFNQYQRHNARQDHTDMVDLFSRTETFLRALRRDLGHNDVALENLAMTKMMIRGNDHEELDQK
jgi:hypothetical protein